MALGLKGSDNPAGVRARERLAGHEILSNAVDACTVVGGVDVEGNNGVAVHAVVVEAGNCGIPGGGKASEEGSSGNGELHFDSMVVFAWEAKVLGLDD